MNNKSICKCVSILFYLDLSLIKIWYFICDVTVKDLYPDLRDHDSVKTYPNIRQLTQNVNFMHHNQHEGQEENTKTFCNQYEADYIVELLHYFLNQGYRWDERHVAV